MLNKNIMWFQNLPLLRINLELPPLILLGKQNVQVRESVNILNKKGERGEREIKEYKVLFCEFIKMVAVPILQK